MVFSSLAVSDVAFSSLREKKIGDVTSGRRGKKKMRERKRKKWAEEENKKSKKKHFVCFSLEYLYSFYFFFSLFFFPAQILELDLFPGVVVQVRLIFFSLLFFLFLLVNHCTVSLFFSTLFFFSSLVLFFLLTFLSSMSPKIRKIIFYWKKVFWGKTCKNFIFHLLQFFASFFSNFFSFSPSALLRTRTRSLS